MTNTSNGRNYIGRPQTDASDVKDVITEFEQNIRIFRYCGGIGGGGCVVPAGIEYVVWPFRVSKYIVYNRKVIFHNPELTGLRFYTDAGADILCPNSIDVEQDFYMGLSASDSDDPETTAKAGTVLNGAPPYDIEFRAEKIPQPTDPSWESIIYVYVWWGNTAWINLGSAFHDLTQPSIELVKHDNELRI